MKTCLLGSVYGGASAPINNIGELFEALDQEPVTLEIIELMKGVMKDERVSSFFRNREKVNKIVNLYNRINPEFRNQIPGYIQRMQRLGLL